MNDKSMCGRGWTHVMHCNTKPDVLVLHTKLLYDGWIITGFP